MSTFEQAVLGTETEAFFDISFEELRAIILEAARTDAAPEQAA